MKTEPEAKDFIQLHLQDPTDVVESGPCKGLLRSSVVLYIVLSRDFKEITRDKSKPESDLIDDAIIFLTTDQQSFRAFNKDGAGTYGSCTCARCGGGIYCLCPEWNQVPPSETRSFWSRPLSPKMIDFLRQEGHTFAVSPAFAVMEEARQWEAWYKKAHLND